MLIFWVTWPHTSRIVTQWPYCKRSKDWRGQTYAQPLLLRSEISLFWRTSCAGDFINFLDTTTGSMQNTPNYDKKLPKVSPFRADLRHKIPVSYRAKTSSKFADHWKFVSCTRSSYQYWLPNQRERWKAQSGPKFRELFAKVHRTVQSYFAWKT